MHAIKPILVFDGARLPMKSRIEEERTKQRRDARLKAEQLLMQGNLAGGNRKFVEAIEISADIVKQLIKHLQNLKVEFVVAPYEADAQLAHLFKQGKIDLVITEDSDLLLFGASKVFFKMNTQGKGIEIDLDDLHKCDSFKYIASLDQPHSTQLETNQLMLLVTCIMSGCDYLESIKGVGFKTALRLVQTHKTNVRAACEELKKSGQFAFNLEEYILQFQRAYLTFKH